MNISKKIHVWVVSDGKPGHQNQSEGLIQALSNYRDVVVIDKPIIPFIKIITILLFKLFKKNKVGNGIPLNPDLIIGTGHQTHTSLLFYKHCYTGRIVIMMSPSIPLSFFDCCFIPRHDKPRARENVFETEGALNRIVPSNSQSPKHGLVLIGGDSKHFTWDTSSVVKQIGLLICEAEITWCLASSRRTPADFLVAIKNTFPEINLIEPDDVDSGWLPMEMQKTGKIWVSADSVSMIYEAITSGAETGVLTLQEKKQTRITKEINKLILDDKVATLSSKNKNSKKKNLYLHEADRCALILIKVFNL